MADSVIKIELNAVIVAVSGNAPQVLIDPGKGAEEVVQIRAPQLSALSASSRMMTDAARSVSRWASLSSRVRLPRPLIAL